MNLQILINYYLTGTFTENKANYLKMPFLNIGSIENSYQLLIDLNCLKRVLAQPFPVLPTSLIETEAQIKTHVISSHT